jgi:hypothetical protein
VVFEVVLVFFFVSPTAKYLLSRQSAGFVGFDAR